MAITVLQCGYFFVWVNSDTSYNTNTMAITVLQALLLLPIFFNMDLLQSFYSSHKLSCSFQPSFAWSSCERKSTLLVLLTIKEQLRTKYRTSIQVVGYKSLWKAQNIIWLDMKIILLTTLTVFYYRVNNEIEA